jgi:hypothetical protein
MIFHGDGHDIKSLGQILKFIAEIVFKHRTIAAALYLERIFLALAVRAQRSGQVPAATPGITVGRAFFFAALHDLPAVFFQGKTGL